MEPLHESALGPLHTCCGCLTWCFRWTPTTEEVGVFLTRLSVLGTIYLLLDCLIQPQYEGVPSLISSGYAGLC